MIYFDKTERNNVIYFDKTERNNVIVFYKTERNTKNRNHWGQEL